MLWLALRFSRLALEVFPASEHAALVVDQQVVVVANEGAARAGVQTGMRLAAALSLAPGVAIYDRAPAREADTLMQLACWAGAFTPHVSVAPPVELLLEVGGCLRLFGGFKPLCKAIVEGAQAQGFSVHLVAAATPLAAQWLVRAVAQYDDSLGKPLCVRPDKLKSSLSRVPIEVMELSNSDAKVMASLGMQRVGDLLALPAAGLARRFGRGLVLQLAQAVGDAPDLRAEFVFPEHFSQTLELPAKVDQAAMLIFAARRLMCGLAGWLAVRAAGVAECDVLLTHDDHLPPSRVKLAFAGATRDLARMERVLRERFERVVLRSAVTDIALVAENPLVMPGASLGLFAQSAAQALDPVIERLRARLGKDAVHGLQVVADHRPECATARVAVGSDLAHTPSAPRPLWLLPQPRSLPEVDGVPDYGGPLQRLTKPERIESGWWDQGENCQGQMQTGDVRRDYYLALSRRGQWLWIFRDGRGWWLHGVFA